FSSALSSSLFFLLTRSPISPLFPYTTLFRSRVRRSHRRDCACRSVGCTDSVPYRTRCRGRRCSGALGRHRGDPHPGDSLDGGNRSEEHTSELQSRENIVCRLLLEKKKRIYEQ